MQRRVRLTKTVGSAGIWTFAALLLWGCKLVAGIAEFGECYARWSDGELVIGNAHIERTWRIDDGLLTATSFRDKEADCEWLAKPADRPAPCPAVLPAAEARTVSVSTRTGRRSLVAEESLTISVVAKGQTTTLAYEFDVFANARGVAVHFHDPSRSAADTPMASRSSPEMSTGVEQSPAVGTAGVTGDSLEDMLLAPQHLRFVQVTLRDGSDRFNELAFESEWLLAPNEGILELSGNVFSVEDPLTGNGLVFLKEAPLPLARPERCAWDIQVDVDGPRRFRFAGQGYPYVLLAYRGGRWGRIAALHAYQRQRRRYDPRRDGLFMTCTWGDRSRDSKINEPFILKEMEAAARLGVDVFIMDDGWQAGRSANSASGKGVWNGYWAASPDFWKPDGKRFPRGFAPVVEAARANRINLGLWFAPDSSNDGANWQRDAECLLAYHHESGMDFFKVDSLKTTTLTGEQNARRFFDRVLQQSQGRIVLDYDITAEVRAGYFGAMEVGPVFIENRYTDWHNYWPHQTLRNLWKLSHYVDPVRLRMEFLNNTRNQGKYAGDRLAPAAYTPDTLFATVLFSSPLGWFESSNLPEPFIASAAKLVNLWKRERAQMFGGSLYPIGSAPDGVAWTGFASVARNRKSGYLLLFREANDDAEWTTTDLPPFDGTHFRVETLAGTGSAEFVNGRLRARIPSKLQYLWLKLSTAH